MDIKVHLLDPIKCIIKIANNISLNEKYKRMAIKIMKCFVTNMSKFFLDKNPIITAAAIIYHVSSIKGKNKSQRTLAFIARISEVSVRKRFGELRELAQDVLSQK